LVELSRAALTRGVEKVARTKGKDPGGNQRKISSHYTNSETSKKKRNPERRDPGGKKQGHSKKNVRRRGGRKGIQGNLFRKKPQKTSGGQKAQRDHRRTIQNLDANRGGCGTPEAFPEGDMITSQRSCLIGRKRSL